MAKSILLVEDSPDDELLFKLILRRNHVENPVLVVRDGMAAIAYLEGREPYSDRSKYPMPCILCIDLKMPGVDGFAVLEWLRQNPATRTKLLVIVLSNIADAAEIRRAYDLGANSFLSKPFTLEDSKNLIRYFSGYWQCSSIP